MGLLTTLGLLGLQHDSNFSVSTTGHLIHPNIAQLLEMGLNYWRFLAPIEAVKERTLGIVPGRLFRMLECIRLLGRLQHALRLDVELG